MREREAKTIAAEALQKARAQAGDSEEAVKVEFVNMMHRDPQLHEALTTLGVARLWESQNLRH
ncbi:hypothetical protein [Caballeronia sordidicola]|uniref:Uncharacterized protein n=1 Tax=Caballeronia sordidicola TaxID=196367 RepID=A0A242N757_CABSO|nr:hypothetical protein [Caballeronia sordidicola]OTP79458.1 hypothetical protein PAMC26577_00925 [Caballeronia sordidicola]